MGSSAQTATIRGMSPKLQLATNLLGIPVLLNRLIMFHSSLYVGASLTLLKLYVIGNKLGEHSCDYVAKGNSLSLISKHVT